MPNPIGIVDGNLKEFAIEALTDCVLTCDTILESETLVIPEARQLIVYGSLNNFGTIIIEGKVIIL